MAKKPTRIAMAFSLTGDNESTDMADNVYGALDRHGLAPQFVTGDDDINALAVAEPGDFTGRWVTVVERRLGGAKCRVALGSTWIRRNAPQGWGSVNHRMINVKGRVKLGHVDMDHVFSPHVDWKAVFVDLCGVLNPLSATLNPFRRDTEGTLGFVNGCPLPAQPKRERITKPVQVDATPWGAFAGVPWGMWLGPLWEDNLRVALADHMIVDGPFLHLTDTVPRDPDMIEADKARLLAALPELFDPNPDFIGLA